MNTMEQKHKGAKNDPDFQWKLMCVNGKLRTRKEVPQMEERGLPIILTPRDISAVLGVSRNKAYEVIHSAGFPSFKIGKQYRVHREKFLAWLNQVEEVA